MADLKPIRSSQDYEDALAEMKALWGTATGTPAGDRLEILATLVDAYEAEHFPIDAPSPQEASQFRSEQQAPTRSGTSARFEIYKDMNGAYRFRFKVNSEVLFTSDAYPNKSLLLAVIDTLRAGAASSIVYDEAA
ncbi:hypothetical protein [Shinella sp. BYT-45]|uniref:hypothetical protein n=1 Tax=Shinella sp. BYT-45 TaxID=3377377 RepID=UPI00397F893E